MFARLSVFGEGFRYSVNVVLSKYIDAALGQAQYELLEDDRCYYGSIPQLPGVWATAATAEECRSELRSTLEDWLLLSFARQLPIPVLDGIDLSVREVA